MFLNPSVLVVCMWLAGCFKNSNKKICSRKIPYSFLPPAGQPCYRQNQSFFLVGISSSQTGVFSSRDVASSHPGADFAKINPELVYEAAEVKGKACLFKELQSIIVAWILPAGCLAGKWGWTVCMHLYLVEYLPTLSLLPVAL